VSLHNVVRVKIAEYLKPKTPAEGDASRVLIGKYFIKFVYVHVKNKHPVPSSKGLLKEVLIGLIFPSQLGCFHEIIY